jgi:hypothetical protein
MTTRALFALLLLLSACGPGTTEDAGAGGSGPDACAELPGKSFSSVELLEIGLGPDGAEMGHWDIFFTETTWAWSYSDVSDAGDYTCVNGDLTATGAAAYEGHYDPSTGRLVWDGVEYED